MNTPTWDHDFVAAERANPMWHTISTPTPVGAVPVFRAHALMLAHAHEHGARFTVASGNRNDQAIKDFNLRYHTNLHSQLYLFEHQHDPGFFPANPPGHSSHELFSDGNPVYRNPDGGIIASGGTIPEYMLGIDATDDGSSNDCTHLVLVLNSLGYHAVRPYSSGSEAHHFVLTSSPVPVLKHWNVIP